MKNELRKIIESRYGSIPDAPKHLRALTLSEDRDFAAGSGRLSLISLVCTTDTEEFSFIIRSVLPTSERKIPIFIYLAESSDIPSRFLPAEEICDLGVGVFILTPSDVADDNGDFKSKIARNLIGARRSKASPSKTAIWSYALSRVIEYALCLDFVDKEKIAVIATESLAPTALVTAVENEKIGYTILNSPSENLTLEHRFARGNLPNDFNSLLSSLAPAFKKRNLLIGLSEDDGLPGSDVQKIAHVRVRNGSRYLSRHDWNYYINFVLK